MLEFDEDLHAYYWNGEIVPSVTQILSELGFMGNGYYTPSSSERGKYVHLACQYFDEGSLEWDSLTPEILPYVKGYEKFLSETGFKPELIEAKVFNEDRYYAGTLDRTGKLKGEDVIIDIKTSSQITKVVGLQLAAYADCFDSSGKYYDRYALQLTKEGDYKLEPFSNGEDFDVWSSAVTLYHWKKARKKKERSFKVINGRNRDHLQQRGKVSCLFG